MKKYLLFLLIPVMVFSLDHISAPYTAVPGASVSSSGWNSNIDTIINGINRAYDTVNVHTDTLSAHKTNIDSKLDTIAQTDLNMSDQDIDSVNNLTSDSAYSIKAQVDTASVTVLTADTIDTRVMTADSIDIGTAGWLKCDTSSFLCTLRSAGATTIVNDSVGIGHYFRIGNYVSITFSGFGCLCNLSSSGARILNFPSTLSTNTIEINMPLPGIGSYGATVYARVRPDSTNVFASSDDEVSFNNTVMNYYIPIE